MIAGSSRISVIVPVYNVEEYVGRCLDSIMQNSYNNLEIICINDESTDNSLQILQAYAEKDNRITVLDRPHGGLSAARNAGLDCAHGEYIAFIDSDDWVHRQYFEVLLKLAEEENADITIANMVRTDCTCEDAVIDLSAVSAVAKSIPELYASKYQSTYVWGRLYRMSLLEGIRFDTKASVEDSLFNAEVLAEKWPLKVRYTDTILYYYYIREGSLISCCDRWDMLDLGMRFMRVAESATNTEVRAVLFRESVKKLLNARYLASFDTRERYRTCNGALKDTFSKTTREGYLAGKQKLMYGALVYVPGLYRRWRIWDDPTLKTWEKQKAAQRNVDTPT